jgi:hypothetical protein
VINAPALSTSYQEQSGLSSLCEHGQRNPGPIPKLSREQIEEIREWIDDYLEEKLELTEGVKAKLDQSRREVAAGQYTTRQLK